jgi:SAM-dependent methyltransferase
MIRAVARRVLPRRVRDAVRPLLRGRRRRSPGRAALAVRAEASLGKLLGSYLPSDHSRQVQAVYYVDQLMRATPAPRAIMDLGCGIGDSVDLFRSYDASVDWVGVDIPWSPEALARQRTDARFVTYDGTALPFPDATFDLIYSRQVLEHVRNVSRHLAEVRRVLRPGGAFIGSTSQLEPYHSRSLWNYTPLGFIELIEEAGMRVVELRPGIDGITLVMRSYLRRPPAFGRWWSDESPLNLLIDEWGRHTGQGAREVNLRKLQFAGQFAFLTRRPER